MKKAESAQQAFRAALKSQEFDPAYYLYGEDEYLKREAARHLIDAAVEPAMRAFNLDQAHGAEIQAESLGVMLGTPPMMASRRVVIIHDVGALRKQARGVLEQYLKAPSADTVLVLVAGNGEKPDKTLPAMATAVELEPLTGAQLPKWVERQVERAGGSIDERAAALLRDVVGDDLMQLDLEVEKLVSYAGNAMITEHAVEAVVGVRREETLGHLLDAIAGRNTEQALAALPLVLQQPKASSVTIVMALSVQVLAMAWGAARNYPPARLKGEYFSMLKAGKSPYTGRAWGEAVDTWVRYARHWSVAELTSALEVLARTDRMLKTSRLSSEEQVLATMILAICRPTGHRRAA